MITDLEKAFDDFADAVEQRLGKASEDAAAVRGLVAQLETQVRSATASVPGPAGERGERGEPGPAGAAGERGASGERGEAGPQGERGADGLQGREGPAGPAGAMGSPGERGAAGERGEPGPQGERGADGLQGREGPAGAAGAAGVPGERGADGIATRAELDAMLDERFREMQARSLIDLYRDVYRAGETYQRGELVTWSGSLFIAKVTTVARPLESPDWKQITKAGRDGRDARKP